MQRLRLAQQAPDAGVPEILLRHVLDVPRQHHDRQARAERVRGAGEGQAGELGHRVVRHEQVERVGRGLEVRQRRRRVALARGAVPQVFQPPHPDAEQGRFVLDQQDALTGAAP